MADLIIKPATGDGNKLILQDKAGGAVLTTADSGITLIKLAPTATASAPTGSEGALYYNSDLNALLQHNGTNWSTAPQAPHYKIEYLVIAGGGSGGGYFRSGGGGAGGYRNSYASETSGKNASTENPWQILTGTTITVVVGAGGARAVAGSYSSIGNRGTDSSITAVSQTTVTSHGGGGGGPYQRSAPSGTFGSGGGSGHNHLGAHTGATGTATQGFDGGDTPNASPQQGAGGGGASAAGADGSTGTAGLTGGNGLSSSITGAAVVRAGGGGGGSYGGGEFMAGGTGGGGNGGSDDNADNHSHVLENGYYLPLAATEPTSGNDYVAGGGGGGLAGYTNAHATHGKGATGIVILRMATASYSTRVTGSPEVDSSTVSGQTILIFTGDGTYTT